VRIWDHQIERGLMKTVEEFKPDAVAVTLLGAPAIPDAMRISRALKALGLPVFWGGTMTSAIPELAARSGCVDYVGIGEGEYTLLELLEVVQGKRKPETVPGIAYVDENGEYQRTADRPFADLADFPPLDYSLIPVERFLVKLSFSDRVCILITSKGCPFNCTFCFNKQFYRCQRRVYPREVIWQQIGTLKEEYAITGLFFTDELFGADKLELRSFCHRIKELGLTWLAQSVVGVLSRADMEMMYDAGCRMLAFGLESGSAEMRKKINKRYDASMLDETFRNCREVGLLTLGQFILGLPDETPEQLCETIRLYFRLRPDANSSFNLYMPIPGSQLCRELEADGRLQPPQSLEAMKRYALSSRYLTYNFSRVPDRELRVVHSFLNWQSAFGQKRQAGKQALREILGMLRGLLGSFRNAGPGDLVRGLWESARLLCSVAWYAHAYPSIRKKYGLYAKNLGRTQWE